MNNINKIMNNHTCEYCKYETKIYSNFIRHTKSKKHDKRLKKCELNKKIYVVTYNYLLEIKKLEEKLEKMDMYAKEKDVFFKYINIPIDKYWYISNLLTYRKAERYDERKIKKRRKLVGEIAKELKITELTSLIEKEKYWDDEKKCYIYGRIKDYIEIKTFTDIVSELKVGKRMEEEVKMKIIVDGKYKRLDINNLHINYTLKDKDMKINNKIFIIMREAYEYENMANTIRERLKYINCNWINYSDIKIHKLTSYLYKYKDKFIIYLFSIFEVLTCLNMADYIFQYIDFTYTDAYYYPIIPDPNDESCKYARGRKRMELNFTSYYSNMKWSFKDPIENLKAGYNLED